MTEELKKEILNILDNVYYWETCPQEYNDRIDAVKKQCTIQIVRHSSEMIAEEYVYKNDFRFQRTQKHGIWFVTYQNHLITFGQYRHDLEEWVDSNYA